MQTAHSEASICLCWGRGGEDAAQLNTELFAARKCSRTLPARQCHVLEDDEAFVLLRCFTNGEHRAYSQVAHAKLRPGALWQAAAVQGWWSERGPCSGQSGRSQQMACTPTRLQDPSETRARAFSELSQIPAHVSLLVPLPSDLKRNSQPQPFPSPR